MKKFTLFAVLAVSLLFSANAIARVTLLKSMPRDNNNHPAAAGTETKVFYNDSDGDGTANDTTGLWQEVFLPTGAECKSVLIQVHSGTDTDYEGDTLVGFLFSHETAGDFIIVPAAGFVRSIGVIAAGSTSLGFVKAAAGAKIAVVILY